MKDNHASQAEVPASAPPPNQIRPPRHILVAHDNCDIRELITEVLVRSGYHVEAAFDGAAAWRALNQTHYDLLITDHEMPEVSGLELLIMLRAVRSTLPVIMASAALPGSEFGRYPWLQPAATLVMPYTVQEFLETVEAILRTTDATKKQAEPPPTV